jgi:hypothetical protein
MKIEDLFSMFQIEDLKDLPMALMALIEGDRDKRDKVYKKLISLNDYDLSHDWFQPLYESELSERKQKKQDFTPYELGVLCSSLTYQEGTLHEPTAGNGGMIIADWWQRCRKFLPWEHFPSEHMVTCWELSSRSIPILLLNLSIRGIMGYVYHGDVLEGTIKQKYILLNRQDDTLAFSDVIKAKLNDKIIQE